MSPLPTDPPHGPPRPPRFPRPLRPNLPLLRVFGALNGESCFARFWIIQRLAFDEVVLGPLLPMQRCSSALGELKPQAKLCCAQKAALGQVAHNGLECQGAH